MRRTWGPAKKFYLLQLGLISHLEIELAYSKKIYNSTWERCKLLFPSHNRNHILFIKMLQNHRNWYMMDKGDKWNQGICLPFSPDLFYPKSRLETCQKIYTTGFWDKKIYTLKVQNFRLFLLKKKQRKCINLVTFC